MKRSAIPLAVAVFSLYACPLFADGCFIPEFAGSAETVDQRAVVVFDGGAETLIIQTAYEGAGEDFAWVIPVPELVTAADIGTVPADIFEDLYSLTEPVAYRQFGSSGGGLFGCSGGGGAQDELRTVRVWETLQVDGYDVAVLSAEESGDLQQWLNDNGYGFPVGHEDELAYYVNKSWFFIAAKISPEGDGGADPPNAGDPGYGQGGEDMRPIKLTFATPQPIYPMRISAVSSNDEVEVLIYAIGRHRLEGENYNTAEVQLTAGWDGTDFPSYYAEQFGQSLQQAGDGSLLVEYSGRLPDYLSQQHAEALGLGAGEYCVTRLRTYLRPEQMQDDVIMARAAEDADFQIIVAQSVQPANRRLACAGWLIAAGLMLGLVRRRRHSLLRYMAVAAVVGIMIV